MNTLVVLSHILSTQAILWVFVPECGEFLKEVHFFGDRTHLKNLNAYRLLREVVERLRDPVANRAGIHKAKLVHTTWHGNYSIVS